MLRNVLFLFGLSTFSLTASTANYTVTVEPNYPASQAQEIYRPLMAYLGRATGHTFTLRTANNYHGHWRDILSNVPVDFSFEEAHFADFRAQRQGFVPLVRVAEPTQFSLLVSPENTAAGPQGLMAGTIVSMPSPSLGYLFLGELYPNPIAQPEIASSAQTFQDGVDSVFAQEAMGTMVPVYMAQQYPNLESVHLSRSLPGRSFNASGKVPAKVRAAVTDAMLKLHENPGLNDVLTEIGTARFIKASAAELASNERMLRRVFGYPKTAPKAATPTPSSTAKPAAAVPVRK